MALNGHRNAGCGRKMRYGFTTGSCAAAAAKAAAFMLLTGKKKTEVEIRTPKGIPYRAKILDISKGEQAVSCAVEKDGGDDPDATTGYFVYAKVSVKNQYDGTDAKKETEIEIDGGEGVGRVTRPGLDQPVGSAAINHIPREMIEKEVAEVCRMADFCGQVYVEISVPGGRELAKKTFNPRLGIEGGISILGTTGIVEPMSEKALLDTIRTELRQHRAMGERSIVVSPGNYGQDYMERTFGYDLDRSVKCSNFIGDAVDMAAECGFEAMLLAGHIGKLVKVSGGMMNTHSREGDCRMELLGAAALLEDVKPSVVRRILNCAVTEEALQMLEEEGKLADVMGRLMDKILFYLDRRSAGRLKIECMMYSNHYGELASSKGAHVLLREIMEEEADGLFCRGGDRRR